WSRLLFEQATLAEGGQLQDPTGFVRRMNAMLLGGESTAAGAPAAGDQGGEAGDTSKSSD
ncbi:MAG TPA: hypothetical protein VK025_09990, partial [Steroidobacter sp.]|nr:hypothetical protein [Steroidobacter sp.]